MITYRGQPFKNVGWEYEYEGDVSVCVCVCVCVCVVCKAAQIRKDES